jgi:hypothetical protein
MATIISTKTSGVGGLSVTGDASGILQLASADGTTALTIDASQNVTLAKGLTVGATAAPAFSASSSSAVAAGANTWTKLPLQTEAFDTNNNFDNVTNYRFTPTVMGYYQFNGACIFATSAALLQLSIYKNGSTLGFPVQNNAASGASISDLVYMNGSTDYVELYGFTGSAQNISGKFSAFLARSA